MKIISLKFLKITDIIVIFIYKAKMNTFLMTTYFFCRNPNKVDLSFECRLKQINHNILSLISDNNVIGQVIKNKDNSFTIKPNLYLSDKLFGDNRSGYGDILLICNETDDPNHRVCKRRNKKQLGELSQWISNMKFQKR